jgi:hypothetical protein
MSTMMMERTAMGMSGMTGGMPGMTMPATMAPSTMMMVPRCTMKVEKVQGGMKMTCVTDDKMACTTMQSLCSMLANGLCSCCMMMNGLMVCCCNMTMGMCKCEMTDKGVCITCTSGDAACGSMIQGCCDYMNTMMKAGCSCCVMMNNTPVCCAC